MEACERKYFCNFLRYIHEATPSAAGRLQKEYCNTDKLRCARYLVHRKLLKGYCPLDEKQLKHIEMTMRSLSPGDIARARTIMDALCK